MTKEALALSDIVAANTLLEQGIIPGESVPEHDVTPSHVADATRNLVDQIIELPIDDLERKDRVLVNAAVLVEESMPLLDSDAIRRAVIIAKLQRATAARPRRVIRYF